MTNILGNILEKKAQIQAEFDASGHQNSPTAEKLKRKALDAISGGNAEWVIYMKEFAKTPEELARLVASDGSENDEGMNDARAYLLAKAPCGTDTLTGFEKGITAILDGIPTG